MNMRIITERFKHQEKQTLGNGLLVKYSPLDQDWENNCDVLFRFKTLELPWKNNQPSISCIPTGIRPLVWEWSPNFERYLYEIYQVPNRSESKFHTANFVRQLEGCIAPGDSHTDIDGDGLVDVTNSGVTLDELHKAIQANAQNEREAMFLTIEIRNVENGFKYF